MQLYKYITANRIDGLLAGRIRFTAEEHKGAVVEIDIADPTFQDAGFQVARAVNYRYQRPKLPLNEAVLMEHFFTKSQEWSYEREFRIVRHLEDSTEVITANPYSIHLFDLPPRCLKRLIFGARFDAVSRQALSKRISKTPGLQHIGLAQAEVDDQEFRLRIETLKE